MKSRERRIAAVLGLIFCLVLSTARALRAIPTETSPPTELDTGFRRLYELKFGEARATFFAWERLHPDDPLGPASVAASFLFEEFYRQGVLSSEFFLDDKRFLNGIEGKADEERRAAFFAANQRAQQTARRLVEKNPRDPNGLFVLTITAGMHADYASIIERRQLESLRLVREAQIHAKNLLAVNADAADAYLALGVANYIIGSLPAHKRFFLWFGGIRGDKRNGLEQLEVAATRGHYLRPFAKILLALASLRENHVERARTQLLELTAEFPKHPLFTRELAKLDKSARRGS